MIKRIAAVLSMVALVGFVSAGSASAVVDPDTITAVSGGFADLKTLLTGTLVPALFGLVLLGIAVAVAIKYLRRGSSKA